jgi:hypothetical protein
MLVLEEMSFRFIYLMSDELADDDIIKKHILKQLFFIFDQQAAYEKRFLPDQIFLINNIFQTNRLDLILFIIIRVINTN